MAATLANNPTRQQLDELDDLLQKMLALPINQLDEALAKPPMAPAAGRPAAPKPQPAPAAAPPAPPTFPAAAVAYGMPPAPAFAADSPGAPPTAATPTAEAARGWSIDLNPKEGSSVLGERSPLAAERPTAPAVEARAMISAPLRVTTVADFPKASNRRGPDVPFLLMPFAAVTHGFDNVMSVFGPLGRLTASTPVRQLMGLAGLSMLGGGLTWGYLVWAGWTW